MKYNGVWSDKFAERLIQFKDPEHAVNEAHAIVIITEWDEFKVLPYEEYYRVMNKPAYIFDNRLILDEEKMNAIGFRYLRIGKKYAESDEIWYLFCI